MGSIDKSCPYCGSDEVYTIEEKLGNIEPQVWYECDECYATWDLQGIKEQHE